VPIAPISVGQSLACPGCGPKTGRGQACTLDCPSHSSWNVGIYARCRNLYLQNALVVFPVATREWPVFTILLELQCLVDAFMCFVSSALVEKLSCVSQFIAGE
jgi:hypothetical protein